MRDFKLQKLRRSYKRSELSEESVDENPFTQFNKWFKEVIDAEIIDGEVCPPNDDCFEVYRLDDSQAGSMRTSKE